MVIRKALVALAPVAVDDVRAASPIADSEGLRGSWGWILALIIAAGVIGVIASDGNEDLPTSP